MIKIAIDGPSGSGKSTLAKNIAKELGFIYVDTGALYRSIGLYMFEHHIDTDTPSAMIAALSGINLKLMHIDGKQTVYLNDENVGERIRTPEISRMASIVSSIPEVRAFLLDLQKDMANRYNVVMDGRDIGTVIMPDAQVKIYLSASAENRAKRRYEELCAKGVKTTYETVLEDLVSRDVKDATREIAPAVAAPDAVPLDNSGLEAHETLQKAMEIVRNKLG